MIKRCVLLVGAIFYYSIAMSQIANSTDEVFEVADVSPQFPGGLEALYKFIQKNIVYPVTAQIASMEGQVFVTFVIDTSGFIEPQSVQTIKGFYPDCDREAERVIKASREKWIPAMKNGKPIRQRNVIPINFRLLGNTQLIYYQAINQIRAIIKEKPAKSRMPDWGMYGDIGMTNLIGEVNPGDSVTLLGWAPWLFIIRNKNIIGYVAYRAIPSTPETEKIIKIVELESPRNEAEIKKADSIKAEQKRNKWKSVVTMTKPPPQAALNVKNRRDSIEVSKNGPVFLRLTSSKKKIYVGECAVVNLAVYISEKNKLKYQFINLNEQLPKILNDQVNKDFCWTAKKNIENIVAEKERIGGVSYDVYTLYSAGYCPIIAQPLLFPSIKLQLAQITEDVKGKNEKNSTFITNPLTIAVKPLPSTISVTSSDYHKLVGEFIVSDSIASKIVAAGESINYSITIKGNGLTFPISPPKIAIENISSNLVGLQHSDTIINNVYYSSKTFTFSLKFKIAGEYDLSNANVFSSYNQHENSVHYFKTATRVSVGKESGTSHPQEYNAFFVKDNIVAIDVSNSMIFQDYVPNRLKAVTQGLNGFLPERKKCDIGIILFGGNAIQLNSGNKDDCYTSDLIQSIDFGKVKPHTSMGNAIWASINSTSKSKASKKLVIIGDGDNTTGFLNPRTCAELAKKYNMRIYTIGVGKTGTFQVSEEGNGMPIFMKSVFSSKVYSDIALSTGGKYYWAKDSESVTKILREIFSAQ